MAIRTLKLEWKKTTLADMAIMPNTYFYMFSLNRKVYYIGISKPSSKQSIQEEIQDKKRINGKFAGQIENFTIWLGYSVESRSENPIKRLTDKTVCEVENLLIFKTQPELNSTCKTSYSGRDLRIVNTKCGKLLKETMAFENKKKRK